MKLKHFIIAGLVAAPVAAIAGSTINGAGASFPAPIYQRWFQDYSTQSGNRVNYQSVGSGAGVRQFIAGTVDFGASIHQIPSGACSIFLAHLPQFSNLGHSPAPLLILHTVHVRRLLDIHTLF